MYMMSEIKKDVKLAFAFFFVGYTVNCIYNAYNGNDIVDGIFRNFYFIPMILAPLCISPRDFKKWNIQKLQIVGFMIILNFMIFNLDGIILEFFWDELHVPTLTYMMPNTPMYPIDFILLGLYVLIFSLKSIIGIMVKRSNLFLIRIISASIK